LDPLLDPKSIAVIGASRNPSAFGNLVVANLLRSGYRGSVFPVHPSEEQINGIPCSRSISDLPESPDLCVIAVRAELGVDSVRACAARGVRAVTVVGSGFAETATEEGVKRQATIIELAREAGMLLLGPNTLGGACFTSGAVWTASANIPEGLGAGRVGLVSQSGGLSTTILAAAMRHGLGIDGFLAVGNEAGVGVPDAVRAFVERGAKAVMCYVETIRDPDAFAVAADYAGDEGVSIVLLKGGSEAAGQVVTSAHTASLAGSTRVLDAALRQWGVHRVSSIDALVAAALLFERFGRTPGSRCGVLGLGGGNAALLADSLAAGGIELATIGPATADKLRALLPDTNATNPFDAGGWFLGRQGDLLGQALDTFVADDSVDVMLHGIVPLSPIRERVYLQGIAGSAHRSPKPAVCLSGHTPQTLERAQRFAEAGVVELPCTYAAVEALRVWLADPPTRAPDRSQSADTQPRASTTPPALDIDPPLSPGERRVLLEDAAARLLSGAGLRFPPSAVVDDPVAAVRAAESLGYPVVIKAIADGLAHRAQAGAVALDLAGPHETSRAAREVLANARAVVGHDIVVRLLVQHQIRSGTEMIVGVNRDPVLGHVVIVGLGGIWSEILNDVAFVLPPVTPQKAESAIRGLRAGEIIGRLGRSGSFSLDALVSLLVHVGRAVSTLGDSVEAIDLNPVIVDGQTASLADALVVLKGPGS
jgi:acyl-CoA synthetase (NDP forming)